MDKAKSSVWLTISVIVTLACVLFALILYPHPHPLDEQLSAFVRIADSDDLWHEAVLKHGTGDHAEAMTLYTQAIEVHPESKMAYLYRGTLHYDQGNYSEAINDYTQALAIDPEFTWALNARGVAFYRSSDSDKAQADFARSHELDPSFIGPLVNQAVIEKLEGNSDEALMLLARAEDFSLASTPTLKVLENIGDIQFSQGDAPSALATYNELVKQYPEYPSAYRERAKIHHNLGNTTEAKTDEEHYQSIAPTKASK